MKNRIVTALLAASAAALLAGCVRAQETGEPPDMEEDLSWQAGERPGFQGRGGPYGMMRGSGGGRAERRGMREDMGGVPGGPAGKGRAGMKGRALPEASEIMAVIKKHDPAFAALLDGLKLKARPKYRMALMMAQRALGPARVEGDESMEKDAVRMVALELAVRELSVKYDKAADSEKQAVKTEIKTKTAELFDLRMKGQEARIRRMEKDLARLKSGLEARKANKAKIIDERVSHLTGESYGW